jgi:hypothetical protein
MEEQKKRLLYFIPSSIAGSNVAKPHADLLPDRDDAHKAMPSYTKSP